MSGPAILQLSAWGARILAESNYEFSILVNWLNETKENTLREILVKTISIHGSKMISNLNPFEIPNRLWLFLLAKNEINPATRWIDLGAKNTHKLVNTLLNDRYIVQGKQRLKKNLSPLEEWTYKKSISTRCKVKSILDCFLPERSWTLMESRADLISSQPGPQVI